MLSPRHGSSEPDFRGELLSPAFRSCRRKWLTRPRIEHFELEVTVEPHEGADAVKRFLRLIIPVQDSPVNHSGWLRLMTGRYKGEPFELHLKLMHPRPG